MAQTFRKRNNRLGRNRNKPGQVTAIGTQAVTASTIAGRPNVEYMRSEVREMMHLYDLIRDVISGSHAVKLAGDKYLPRPNSEDVSDANIARYEAYKKRAIFFNATRRTVFALVGQIFLRDPQVNVPTNLDPLKLDCNGENVSLEQVAKSAALFTISFGRAGYHVDYPTASASLSKLDLDSGDYRPTIQVYGARSIRNWREALRGARKVNTLIVLEEPFSHHDDGFEAQTSYQYKVLRLVPIEAATSRMAASMPTTYVADYGDAIFAATSDKTDVYMLEVWRSENTNDTLYGGGSYGVVETYFPRGYDGKFLNEIPWQFIGAENNDSAVDHPPMADLAEVNIAHYRNSADYEESAFIIGQPTPYVTGVTEDWNTNVLKGNIQLGSRGVIALPAGGAAGLLQAAPNSLAKEAMESKERQMMALGAKLVEQRSVQRTATEAQMEGASDTSILASIATNVEMATMWALKQACIFTGDDPNSVTFSLNSEFDLTRMDPAERQQLLLEYEADMLAFTEVRSALRRGGIATLDDDEATKAIDKQKADKQAAAINVAQKQNIKPVNPDNVTPTASA